MEKILGVDLGTNSIGLALREENEFDWFGVYTFKKGVGFGKSGEFSFAAERTKHRSSRRLYNARRYRKWETLKILIENDYCPLTIDELNKWKYYLKGKGRVFPRNNEIFNNWIKLDFNNDGVADYTSPYQLRRELIKETLNINEQINRHKVGRAFYHIAQRRGFKSSRKGGDNEKTSVHKGSTKTKTIGRNEYENLILQEGTLGAAFAFLEDNGIRVRNRYTLRSDYYSEIIEISKKQRLTSEFAEQVTKAVFFQRPLRSQKGLVGKCTLEKNKYRCPISHPKFEAFRAWSLINTIKYKNEETNKFLPLPFELKQKIFDEVFFRKSKANFDFADIRKFIDKNSGENWQLNYNKKLDKNNVSGCPVSARLKSVFGNNWENIKITANRKNKKGETKQVTYSIDDIWHILFSYEDEEAFQEFTSKVLKLNEDQCKDMNTLWNSFPVGYANLSLYAISNILPFLQKGLIYTEAVLLAKIPRLIGWQLFEQNKQVITDAIRDEIKINRKEKEIITIANNLISKYKVLNFEHQFAYKNTEYKIDSSDLKDVEANTIKYFGEKKWGKISANEKNTILDQVKEKYQEFFYSGKRAYFKPPHLLEQVKDFLRDNFNLADNELEKMYHPSQIDIYPKDEEKQFLKSPKTAAFKNPMAYKTLYRLKDVINHLIEIGKIDSETRVVVEIAREMNDANRRSAYETYQRRRENENKEFAIAITELLKDPGFNGNANSNSKTDLNKMRLWTEQMENNDDLFKNILATKEDVKKYRLWKEQSSRCIYTGRVISITDLFNPNTIDFEHTIPRSKSFDSSLANLTVCYADYNRNIKKTRIPRELPNYKEATNDYSAIEHSLEKWKDRIDDLKKQIEFWKLKSKIAKDKESKDTAIREKHLRNFEYEYWKDKVDRFTREDIPQGFVNSQLRDTQIISKYAFHYLKTIFNKVEVQKGTVTSQFRKIFEVQEKYEAKNRSKHHHHAIDAAVLTLIPEPAKREEILRKCYEYEELYNKQYHEKPFPGFHQSSITEIENTILINNIPNKDQALTKSKRIVRNRGKVVWLRDKNGVLLRDENGDKIAKIAQGDSIRGQLHEASYYGKIRLPKYDENGKFLRDISGSIIMSDEYRVVKREAIDKLKIEKGQIKDEVVDKLLKLHIEEQLAQGKEITKVVDFNGKIIRHIRIHPKASRAESLIALKPHCYESSYDHKKDIYVKTGDNYAFALYISKDGKKKIVSRNLFDVKGFDAETSVKEIFEPTINLTKTKIASLHHVFQVGQKVLFYENSPQELKDLGNVTDRMYYVHTLFSAVDGRIRFQHHLEARSDEQLLLDFSKDIFGIKGKNGFSKFTTDFIQPRLLLSPSNFNFIIEGLDFEFSLDSTITYLFQ